MKRIGLHNYEEWFLDYAEDRLSVAERAQVEEFVSRYPMLQEEFCGLFGLPVVAPDPVQMDDKNFLRKKISACGPVNADNYMSFFVAALERDLNVEESASLEKFLTANPSLVKEYELVQQLKLEPELSTIFPDLPLLYRRREPARIIPLFPALGMGAAAAVLLLVGWFVLLRPSSPERLSAGAGMIHQKNISLTVPLSLPPVPEKTETKNNVQHKIDPVRNPSHGLTLTPVPFLESELLLVDASSDHQTAGAVREDIGVPVISVKERNAIAFPKRNNDQTNIVDAGARWLSGITNESWVLRIDRDEKGKTKKIRLSSPILNFNP